MPGTFVRDAAQVSLLAGVTTTTAAGANQAGTAHEIGWSGDTQFVLDIAAKSGTTPTISVDIQGSEVSNFAAGTIVTLGTIVGVDPAVGASFQIRANVDSRYVRAVSTVTGTSGNFTATVVPVPANDRRTRGKRPSSKAVV
jgi:hypothetical protein